ncbi:hypothetical protein AAMO2058_001686400 [Amorphochlora amoebiformis]
MDYVATVFAGAAAIRAIYSVVRSQNKSTEVEIRITPTKGRVLSISSSVVYGYVGNKASTFPMQVMGFDVDPINSVQLSNHTGYKNFKGEKLEGKKLEELYIGLEQLNLDSTYTHIMTGYLGKESFGDEVASLLLKIKKKNPSVTFICDPVLGDDGKLYVPECFVSLYRDKLIPHAALVTPNQSEAEWLSDIKISDLDSAYKAVRAIINKGAQNVVITSLHLPGREAYVDVIAVSQGLREGEYYHLSLPRQKGKYSGCGDLCTGLLLVWFHHYPNDFKTLLEKTFASIQAVIRRTRIQGIERCNWTELELIASKKEIESPTVIESARLRYSSYRKHTLMATTRVTL